jgi:hypothetical protein
LEIYWKLELGNWKFRAVRGDGVLFVERSSELVLCGLPKQFYCEGVVKARLNGHAPTPIFVILRLLV